MEVRYAQKPGFSLVELVIIVVIIGIIAAIAVPRMSASGESARLAALQRSLASVRTAIDMYIAEHGGKTPDRDELGNPDGNDNFVERLIGTTDADGKINSSGLYGPYLSLFPVNPFNDMDTLRIGAEPAGIDEHGWHYDPATTRLSADDSPQHASL